jgi:hypothetical protein
MRHGVRYYLVLHDVDPDTGETQEIARGAPAREVGERLGLGQPSDPEGLGIWYIEAATPAVVGA